MSGTAIEQDTGDWLVDVAGRVVNQCTYDFAFTLGIGDTPPHITFVVGTRFVLRTPAGVEHVLDPEDEPALMAPTLALLRRRVSRMLATSNGRMSVTFDDGTELTVDPDDDYEAWHVTGPAGMIMVSVPGASSSPGWRTLSRDASRGPAGNVRSARGVAPGLQQGAQAHVRSAADPRRK